jgi:hypothetical protein
MHLCLLSHFRAILRAVGDASFEVPPGLQHANRTEWQVQYFLKMAEYRYVLYLQLLRSIDPNVETWPLPPWYDIDPLQLMVFAPMNLFSRQLN